MKKIILIISVLVLVLAGSQCNYNGEATLVVINLGELTITAKVEYATNFIYPGERGTFNLTWPGHDDMHINLITYPVNNPEKGESLSLWMEDGETREIEVAYYYEE
jgi:hypothetical protein